MKFMKIFNIASKLFSTIIDFWIVLSHLQYLEIRRKTYAISFPRPIVWILSCLLDAPHKFWLFINNEKLNNGNRFRSSVFVKKFAKHKNIYLRRNIFKKKQKIEYNLIRK